MPAERSRAGRACSACRKQKTRCYAPERIGAACLRCNTLRQHCSFVAEVGVSPNFQADARSFSGDGQQSSTATATDARLHRLESAVSALLERFGVERVACSGSSTPLRQSKDSHQNSATAKSGVASLDEDSVAPVFVLRDLAAEGDSIARQNKQSMTGGLTMENEDIINSGLISPHEAISLMSIFQEHYGRWVAFDPGTPPEILLQKVRKSPLLLCACYLIAIRHLSAEAAANLAPRLFEMAKSLLSSALLVTPQSLDFFQAVNVLCMWSTTVGQTPLSIDSWLVSGFALQHCFSTNVFEPIISRGKSTNLTRHSLDKLRIWNHLCLVHLHYCVGTRRKAIIGREQIDMCKEILNSDHATNFETRMVAEVNLYWIIYENCTGSVLDLPKAQAKLHEWKRKWNFVLEQPRSQFLEMGFHFAQLLAYERALKSRSARVRDSLLNEMIRLSAAIVKLAMDTTDERTKHLSDHIYHMITFAAVTLCRLLNLYEPQLASAHNIPDLDSLVLTVIDWLKFIGLPCHTGYTLGKIVAAIHKKLRPDAQPVPPPAIMDVSGDWLESFVPTFLPDILDTEISPGGNWNFIPDWEPFMPNGSIT